MRDLALVVGGVVGCGDLLGEDELADGSAVRFDDLSLERRDLPLLDLELRLMGHDGVWLSTRQRCRRFLLL